MSRWGYLLVLEGWNKFLCRHITEHDVDRELQRRHRESTERLLNSR